jgi:hypothetical protein
MRTHDQSSRGLLKLAGLTSVLLHRLLRPGSYADGRTDVVAQVFARERKDPDARRIKGVVV